MRQEHHMQRQEHGPQPGMLCHHSSRLADVLARRALNRAFPERPSLPSQRTVPAAVGRELPEEAPHSAGDPGARLRTAWLHGGPPIPDHASCGGRFAPPIREVPRVPGCGPTVAVRSCSALDPGAVPAPAARISRTGAMDVGDPGTPAGPRGKSASGSTHRGRSRRLRCTGTPVPVCRPPHRGRPG